MGLVALDAVRHRAGARRLSGIPRAQMAAHWDESDIGALSGRTALVTGANAGLGLQISRLLAEHGARVLMACRDVNKAAAAADSLRARGPIGTLETRSLDLASLASIDELAGRIRAEEPALHLLINNAGVMAVDHAVTDDGFEMHLGVNHLGHFALTEGLLPLLLATPGSRVVTHSSMGHRAGRVDFDDLMYERRRYRRWGAYLQSKLANLLFAIELQRRLGPGAPTTSVAAHPGASNTELGHRGTSWTNTAVRFVVPRTTQSAALGARPVLRAATDPDVVGGEFFGPRWVYAGAAPVREVPSRRARDRSDAQRLWAASERLTGRRFLSG